MHTLIKQKKHYARKNSTKHPTKHKGFTLIELMVVIAVIGVLATVTIASYGGAREKARDTERITEIGQLALAVERYYDACDEYPDETGGPTVVDLGASNGNCPAGVTLVTFVGTSLPKLPGTTDDYSYSVAGDNLSFVLRATLELASNPALLDDATGHPLGGCVAADVYCFGS